MASWRRARDTNAIHVTPDAGPALCGIDYQLLGRIVYEPHRVAANLCRACAGKLLAATDDALAAVAAHRTDARQLMREVLRLTPGGEHGDLLIQAREQFVRGDPEGAEDSLRRWREQMRALGLLPAA